MGQKAPVFPFFQAKSAKEKVYCENMLQQLSHNFLGGRNQLSVGFFMQGQNSHLLGLL
jgi:hypothetical protein